MEYVSSALEIKGLGCIRAGRWVFRRLQAQVAFGQMLHLQGPNGSGKTSLLRVLAGLLRPAQGQVLWAGVPVADAHAARMPDAYRQHLSWAGHACGLKPDLTAVENLRASQALRGTPVGAADAQHALAQAGMAVSANEPVKHLSQGQMRRVALAALWLRPSGQGLWLLDEPFNALDAQATEGLAQLMARHVRQGGVAVFSSHQPVDLGMPVQTLCLA